MLNSIRPALVIFTFLTLLTGAAYPLVITGFAEGLFAGRAEGSLIIVDGKAVGSSLIGQNFTEARHFWGRPSATGGMPYNALASAGTNQGPLNPALIDAVTARIEALRLADPGNSAIVPVDLVTASGSGLDPHISVAAARYQLARVARTRQMDPAVLEALVAKHTRGRLLGLFGEPRINVLELNLALDGVVE